MSAEPFNYCPRGARALTEHEGEIILIGNYIFERKNEVMLCYHAIATGRIQLGAELAEYRRCKPAELRPWRRATGPVGA